MTENNTTMNNQAVAFKHFTLNDIIEYLEKRNPDEEMVYSLTFDALSRVGEIKLIARKEKTTVSKNLSTINLIVSDAVKRTVAFFKIDAAVIPVCEMAMGIIFGEAKNIQSPKQVSNNESINKRTLNIDDLQKIMFPEEDQEGVNKLAKKDKHPSIHVSFFDTSIPVLEIVDDKGTGKAIVQHLLDKNIVSSLRYFDETGKVTKVINVTLS